MKRFIALLITIVGLMSFCPPQAWADDVFYVKNVEQQQYLGIEGNLSVVESSDKLLCTFSAQSDGTFNVGISDNYLHIGTGNRWSKGAATKVTIFKVNAEGTSASTVTTLEAGSTYVMVSSPNYAISGTNFGTGNSRRLNSETITVESTVATSLTDNVKWVLEPSDVTDDRTDIEGINLKNAAGDYLAFTSGHAISVSTSPYTYNIRKVNLVDSAWKVWSEDNYQFNSGSNGFFSPAPSNNSTSLNFYFYEVSISGSTLTANLVAQPEVGKSYLFVADKLGSYYAAYGEMASRNTTSVRLDVVAIPGSELPTSITINAGDATSDGGTVDLQKVAWTIVDPNAPVLPEQMRLVFSDVQSGGATISVTDGTNPVAGVTATLVNIQRGSGTGEPTGSTLVTGGIVPTENLLCPSYDNAVGAWWQLTFKIEGAEGFDFNKLQADVHALTAGGAVQGNDPKSWKIEYMLGNSLESLAAYATCPAEEIAKGYQDGSLRHHVMTATADVKATATEPLYLVMKMTKTAGGGCFAGVKYVDLSYVSPWEKLAEVLVEAEAYNIGQGLGQYNAEGYAEAYSNASAINENHAKGDDATEAELTEAIAQLTSAVNALTLNMPKPGQFFRIKTSGTHIPTPTYMKGEQNGSNRVMFTQDAAEIEGVNTIFCYFADPKTNGQYLACYGNGMTAANNSNFMGIQQYPATTAIAFQAATTGEKVGKYNIKFAGNRFLFTNVAGLYGDAGSGNTAEGYNFELEEVTELPVAFNEHGDGYATLYSPAALEIPADVEAYTMHEGTEGYLHANQLTDVIPANTAVVLKGTANTTVDFAVSTGGEADEENVLTGTVPGIAKVANSYVFSIVNSDAGFYQFGGDNLAGFKAYYVNSNSEVQGFVIDFGGITTGINAAQQAQGQKASFDLQGRRVSKAVRGLYIQNGVKVIK